MFHLQLVLSFSLFLGSIICDDPQVVIPQGILQGDTRLNRDGGTYYAFKSIPYAKPPLGELRFSAPQAADSWDGIRDATQELPQCRQQDSDAEDLGQEDCLYLNIYTPGIPAENVTDKPVMIFIHGGGFGVGSAQENSFGGQFLLTEDVVLVVINYRLGVFGFLTLDDPNLGVTGNAGLKDQSFAFKWVNDNIEYFGGDPNNIMIFGQSAGGISVHLHLLSSMSKGLFHKAISESAVSLTPDAFATTRNLALLVADELGIQTENWEEMLASLRDAPVEDLYEAEMTLTSIDRDYVGPIVEIESNEATFLEKTPMEIIESGDFTKVPYVVGCTNREALSLARNIDGVNPLITDLSQYIPPDLQIEAGSEEEQDIIQRFKDFYYDGGEPSPDTFFQDVQLVTDWVCIFQTYRASLAQLEATTYPIYYYHFSADTLYNLKHDTPEVAIYPGAAHFDELGYLFHLSTTPEVEDGSIEDVASRNMVDLWTNFAKYGNPTPDGFSYTWLSVEEDQFNYLEIETNGTYPSVSLLPDNMQLWSDIYADYYPRL